MEYAKSTYNSQYEKWMPWIEDVYLRWFTKDNKTSYTAKQNLDKTKVTGIEQVDTLQDGINHLAAGQVGQGGLLQPVGDLVSREGVNRAERQGKDDKGGYGPGPMNSVADGGKAAGGAVVDGGKAVGSGLTSGVKSAGGLVGSAFGGGNKQQEGQQKPAQ